MGGNKDGRTKIPIKVDMSIFFKDERSKVLLMFNPGWETVEGLQKHVETLFGLEAVQFLSDDGWFVPSQESIEVIKFCTSLKAIIPCHTLQKKKIKKSKKAKKHKSGLESEESLQNVDSNDAETDASRKKRKYQSMQGDFANSTPNNSKRIKNDGQTNATALLKLQQENKSSEISSTSGHLPQKSLSRSSTDKKSKQEKTRSNASTVTAINKGEKAESVVNDGSSAAEVQSKSSQKHKDFKTTKDESINEDVEMATPPARPRSLPSSTFISESTNCTKKSPVSSAKNPFKNQPVNKKHFYFNESGEITTTTENNSENKENKVETKVIFHCTLSNSDPKRRRIFQIKPNELESKKPSCKQIIEIQENIALKPLDLQLDLNKSQIFDAKPMQETTCELDAGNSLINNSNDHTKKIKDDETCEINISGKENTTDEGNSSLNDTGNTASTTIDNYKKDSVSKSLDKQTNKENDNISTNQTSNVGNYRSSIANEGNEISTDSVDCVDLSVDVDDDDDQFGDKSSLKKSKTVQDTSNYDSSDVEEVSEIIDLNETEDAGSSSNSFRHNSKNTSIKVRNIMPLCEKLVELPEIGDVVVFKIPYINYKGNLCNTDFLAGKAQYINQRTKTVKLLVLDGHSELSCAPSKFLTNLDNSMCEQKYVQMKLSDMVDPRICRRK